MSFKEIMVLGVDEVRTHKMASDDPRYMVYFELSIVPPKGWKDILEKGSGRFRVDGRHVVVQCLFNEIGAMLDAVRKEVAWTNLKYREFLPTGLNLGEEKKRGPYFIEDMTVHVYPPSNNHITYNGQKIYGTPPKGNYVKCSICFGRGQS